MLSQGNSRREFLRMGAAFGLVSLASVSVGVPSSAAQNPPPPPPDPSQPVWKATIVPPGEPGDPMVVSGRVFAPDGERTVEGVFVYAYNTDKNGYYSPDGKVGHPRLNGYMKTEAEGRFELHTIVPGHYPGMHIPAHVHFNLWGAGYPVQWAEELRFEGDSFLKESMKSESEARGKFATIQPLIRGSDGAYHCEINLRLLDKSNYSGH